jgi:ATP-dependent DNA helicase RecG
MYQIYTEKESKTLEFKVKVSEFKKLINTCVAFANGAGGEIIVGIEDKTLHIIGISETDREKLYEDFPNSLYDSVSPSLIPQIYEKNLGDRQVVIIKIYPGTKKPYFLKRLGTPSGIYIRVGTSTRKANIESVEDLSREQRRVSFDEESSGQPVSVLSNQLLERFYGHDLSERRLQADKVITRNQSFTHDAIVTIGGLLMFNESPDDYIPEANIICTRFSGKGSRSIIQTIELQGSIPNLAESAFLLLSDWLEREYQLKGIQLKGKNLIPLEALREAIINALIHRKYSIPGAIKIGLYEDRLEIFSPGSFPGMISLKNLGDGTTFLRNIIISRIARKMRLIEKLGTGIRLIFDSCKKEGLKLPEYNEDGDFVKVTFFFKKSVSDISISTDLIFSIIKEKGMIKPRDLESHFNVSRSTISRKLRSLVENGSLKRFGKGAGVSYRKSNPD